MKVLNLMYPDESEVKFKISRFPDGQQDIVIAELKVNSNEGFWATPDDYSVNSKVWRKYFIDHSMISVQIKSRFNSFRDLELIICATKAIRRLGVKSIHLNIPYLLGARSDRQFQDGGNSYLVDVIAPIINSLNFESVTVFDVHSDVAAACINNLKVISNLELVRTAISKIKNAENILIVSPDAGANKKIYKLMDSLDYEGQIVTCSKSRDINGNLSKTVVPWIQNSEKTDRIIIDDICDGGATFIKIAQELKIQGVTGKIHLIVSHGIFSKGFKELSQYFDGIYTTDSIRSDFDWEQKERDNTAICKIIRI